MDDVDNMTTLSSTSTTEETGAEAMREAAAKVCDHTREIIGAATGSSIALALSEAKDRIRALPLPTTPAPVEVEQMEAMIAIQRRALLAVRGWQGEQNPAGNTYRTPIGFKGSPFDYLRKLANDGLKESARIAWGIDDPATPAPVEPESEREALERILEVRVNGWDKVWTGANRCQDIARAALRPSTDAAAQPTDAEIRDV